MNAKEYRSLPFYRIWRNKVLERDHYTCQDCGSFGGPLDVHHIVPFAEDVNGRFDPDNGIALCPLCHGRRHGYSNGFSRRRLPKREKERIKHFKLHRFNSIHNTGVYQRRSTPCK